MANSNPRRCAVLYHASSCCSNLKGFSDSVQGRVPPQLSAHGVTAAMWARWMRENDEECKPHSSTRCLHIIAVTLFCIAFIPGFLLTRFTRQRNWSKWQINTAAWLDRVNADLKPLGMFCRFRCQTRKGEREVNTHLVFALDPDESAALEAEPTPRGLCYPSWTDDNVVW
mmetsp:Transcript_19605/g.48868  ORF Transcript_19605/g.48868 Transcript_19605/m.48868 type:complete len:170 (+) Transcript_19605:150-659(+)|eukprot:CAMPEP_0174900674 /NCGR_PEP_ID=MMETSP0167-20121228/32215_1 /TAXON_ID=38298 /ORGANISM="Rhodella maculata, Strain CCMP736" /LENGTH=169 /DNA_ID=CAMNT_0016142139 /DNA_START=122 /DNA_END=631 /DNA_ORIENTATION=+